MFFFSDEDLQEAPSMFNHAGGGGGPHSPN